MSMIKVENLTFSYSSNYDNIFENVNLQIDTDWKLGLVGRNGRGKTTLLNLLQNKFEFSGKITSSVIRAVELYRYLLSYSNRKSVVRFHTDNDICRTRQSLSK